MQFIDTHDGVGIGLGEFAAGNEILGLLHDHAHFPEVVGGEARETTRIDDEHGRLHADAWDAQDALIVVAIDIHRKGFGVAQCPREFGIDVEVKVRMLVVHELIGAELVEAHEPVGLIETVLTNEGRLLQDGQTRVVGVHTDIT